MSETEVTTKPRFRCPKCHQCTALWRGVELDGWQSVGANLAPEGKRSGIDRDVYWDHVSPDGCYGCGNCQWEGGAAQLERIGIGDELLPDPIPGQEQMGV